MQTFKKLLALPALWLMACGVIYFAYPFVLFPAPQDEGPTLLSGQELWSYGDCQALSLPAQLGQKTLVYFHGNNESLYQIQALMQDISERGFGVLAMEYPGYGSLTGSTNEAGIDACAEALMAELEARDVMQKDRVLVGYSLGTGVATEMAFREQGTALILLAPYTSIAEVAQGYLPVFPMRRLMGDPFDSAREAPEVFMPVLLFHGTDDRTIPYEMSQKLVTLFPNAVLETREGLGHKDLWDEKTLNSITAFVSEL